MIRIGAVIWLVVVALLGVGLFQVKYAVRDKERELRQIEHRVAESRDAIRVLEADWSYLNDPLRLADLARRHLDLVPAMAGQIATFDALPPRLSPPQVMVEAPAPPLPPLPAAVDAATALATAGEDADIASILADMERATLAGKGEGQ